MLIPSIDLMGGKIVQLVQGQKKALEFDDFEPWLERFSKYPLVQLVCALMKRLCCQVGGGIRTPKRAQEMLADGAQRVVVGSALIEEGKVNTAFAQQFADQVGADNLVFAADSKNGRVATRGWRHLTEITAVQMIRALEPCCSGFLYTNIDTEGLLMGIPVDVVVELRQVTKKQLIVAGGIRTEEEIEQLHRLGIDAVVGMAIYLELLKV